MGCPHACQGALLLCSFGIAPAPYNSLPNLRVQTQSKCGGNMVSNAPFINASPFGRCMAPQFIPIGGAPCVPSLSPFITTSVTSLFGGSPSINIGSKLVCALGGMVSILQPGQMTVMV